jgi:OmcA/MtrC family decaheme c-type cytochrome
MSKRLLVRILFCTVIFICAAALIGGQFSPVASTTKVGKANAKANPNMLDYLRPGLIVKVQSVEIAADGTVKARVRFTDPKNVPLDRDGIYTAGAIAASAIVAYIPKGQTQYVAYTTRVASSTITGVTTNQAAADSGGVWAKVGEGEYTYTFRTKLPATYEKGSTHAVGVYANRNITEFGLGESLDDDVYTFVPDNSSKPAGRDLVKTASCSNCHYEYFAFHGTTGRVSMEMCVLCHTPQTMDPDTGNTVDMPVMTHKIHRGAGLPSVVAGGKYSIIGRNGEVDYSHVALPTDVRNCQVCHDTKAGAPAANTLSPNRAACGACHDNVDFATGENHINLKINDDKMCSMCHPATGKEFDPSIAGAHLLDYNSEQLTGIDWAIIKVDNGTPGSKPTITFTLKDKKGNPLAPSDFQRLNAVLAGPSMDYTAKFGTAVTPGYVSESLLNVKDGGNGTWTYTMTNSVPADAKGSFSISLDGRRVESITKKGAAVNVQYGTKSFVYYFSVDNSPVEPRREVVTIEKCNSCHVSLRLHGSNRVDNVQHCVVCHNPVQTDAAVRPKDAGAPQSIDFRQMIHSIHGGAAISEHYGTEPYVVYGNASSKHDYSEVVYPGRLAGCTACHVNGSEALPRPETNSVVANPRGYMDPTGPQAAACLACHRSKATAAHAMSNTNRLGEACAACHGLTSEAGVQKMHKAPAVPTGHH